MNKVITVAVREFIETVKTKAFLLGTVIMPMLIVLAVGAMDYIEKLVESDTLKLRKIVFVDHSGNLSAGFMKQIAAYNEENPKKAFEATTEAIGEADLSTLAARIREGELYAYVVIPADTSVDGPAFRLGRKDSQLEPGRQLHKMLNEAVWSLRFAAAGLDRQSVKQLETPVVLNTIDVQTGEASKGDDLARFLTPLVFMLLLFMGTMGISQGLLTSVIEEKSSRVVEVLLSAVSPTQLMAGKILGMVAVGAVLMGVWGCLGYFGARAQNVGYLVTPYRLTIVVLFFVPGFLLMASILGAIGSACNTVKEAQSMVFPISLLTLMPMMFWWLISQNPTSPFSLVLSYVPPITPFVMVLRICADPETPVWQIVTTLALLWVAVLGAMWAAGKVFRVGVLMYGKPPSLGELLHWVRYA